MSQASDKSPLTNEEIIEDLTKDLKSHCIKNDENASQCMGDAETINKIADDFDTDDQTDEKKNDLLDDFIDEDLLKEEEPNLDEEIKLERQKKAIELKNKGNDAFKNGEYIDSLKLYTEALRLCPLSYQNDRSILYGNRAASKSKLNRKLTAIDDCKKAIELNPNYVRAYLRRAKLYEETEKFHDSLEDYKKALELDPGIPEARAATVRLPPLIEEQNEKLKTEMLGKLKDLGNMFLKPFGLSTDNFQLQQDPNTGGYSMNFQQNNK